MLKLFLCFFIVLSLDADIILARLENIISNEKQKFGLDNYTFKCNLYGVLALETLYNKSKTNSLCQKSIDAFYKKYPKKKYFTYNILKYKQLYHIENKKTGCVIYAKGQVTLAELLLNEGLAIKKPIFKDEEFEYYYTAAQKKAKMQKKGLWNEDIFTSCVAELYEK
ncbi:thermonuclease family protein [Sulfurimonas sp.]|uniref:thermonuclease family protein n=1 Tax=Sulfurimonas sp. TaxID=2022749 RepID=UPI002AB1E696|nr:thermonuclease family protein [Sulfurimonas sp.]